MPTGIYQHKKRPPRSEEWKRKLGLANKGKKRSEEFKRRVSEKLKGIVRSPETRAKMRAFRLGKKLPELHIQHIRDFYKNGGVGNMKGKKHKPETKEKMRQAALQNGTKPITKYGSDCWNWKGGITPLNKQIRMSFEFKQWRKAVFKRDEYKCILCGYPSKGTRPPDIHADHIKPFAKYPELRLDIANGRTLCVPCHKNTNTYGGNTR